MKINCRFCNLSIEQSRFSAHYRKKHKMDDLRDRVEIRPRIIPEIESTESKQDPCLICFEGHSTVLKPCKHDSYCYPCLSRWWANSNRIPSCPLCRANISSIIKDDQIIFLRRRTTRFRRRGNTPSFISSF